MKKRMKRQASMSSLDDVREHGFDALTEEDWQRLDEIADDVDGQFSDDLQAVVDAHKRGEIGSGSAGSASTNTATDGEGEGDDVEATDDQGQLDGRIMARSDRFGPDVLEDMTVAAKQGLLDELRDAEDEQ
jgi:hypothetical protein